MAEEDQVTLPELFRSRVEMPDGSHADCFGEAPPAPEDVARDAVARQRASESRRHKTT